MAHNFHNGQVPMGYPPTAPPRHSSLQATSIPLCEPFPTRSSESSSLRSATSFDSRRSSNDSGSSKPRLSRDQNSYLESIFASCQKPSTANKKVYAAQLNLSLEKVNNWFQNRRAKNKHELKKKGSYNLLWQKTQQPHLQNGFDPNIFAGHDQGWVDGTFYNQTYDPRTFVGPATQVGPEIPPDQFTDEHHPSSSNGPPPYGEQEGYHPYDASQSYEMPTSMDAFDTSFFGLGDPDQPLTNEQHVGREKRFPFPSYTSMDPISEETEEPPVHVQAQHEVTQPGTSAPRRHEPDVPSSFTLNPEDFAMPSDLPRHSQRERSMQPPLQPTWGDTAYTNQSNPGQALVGNDQQHNPAPVIANLPVRDRNTTLGAQSTTVHIDAFAWPQSGSQPRMRSSQNGRNFHSHSDHAQLSTSADRADSAMGHELSPIPPTGLAEQRRDSTVSSLAEHMGGVDVQSQVPDSASMHSSSNPNLSLRRQKRPPALGIVSSRSTSFTSAGPGSPRNLTVTSQELRRIKSFGVLNGRVQKMGITSTQRSPMHLNFRDGDLSRSISTQSLNNKAAADRWKLDHNVPMTPVSQPDPAPSPALIMNVTGSVGVPMPQPQWIPHPQMQPDRRMSASTQVQPPYGTTQAPVFFSHDPLNADQYGMPLQYSSPPETPADAYTHFDISHNTPDIHTIPTVPNSAPAQHPDFHHQQYTFTTQMAHPYGSMLQAMPPVGHQVSPGGQVFQAPQRAMHHGPMHQAEPAIHESFYQDPGISTSNLSPKDSEMSRHIPLLMHEQQPPRLHHVPSGQLQEQRPFEYFEPPIQGPAYQPQPQFNLPSQHHVQQSPPQRIHHVQSQPRMQTPQMHPPLYLRTQSHSRSPSGQKTPQQTTPSLSQVTPRQHRPSHSLSKLPFSTDKPEAFNTWDSRSEKPSPAPPTTKVDYHYITWKPEQDSSPTTLPTKAQYGPLVFHNSYLGDRGVVATSPTVKG